MTLDQPKGLFPLRDDVLADEHRDEYQQYMNKFFLRLIELNINIYILERLSAFPYDLLAEGRTDDGFFFPLIIKNTLEACILMITKVATDGGPDVFTLPRLRNMLSQMVKSNHEPEINARLKELKFDQKTRELLKKAATIRDSRIGHFLSKPSEEEMPLSEIKILRDELNSLLQGLSLGPEYYMLPSSYQAQESDVEWVLDSIAKSSDLINMPEQDPERWVYRRGGFTDNEIAQINYYRERFGLPQVSKGQ